MLRAVFAAGLCNLDAFLGSDTVRHFSADGRVVAGRPLPLSSPENADLARTHFGVVPERLIEHEKIWFPSFPYEWPREMLASAAALTIDLALGLTAEHLILKDGTPFNVLFRGPRPVFIDALSVEPRRAGDAIWSAEAQFARTFLIPLLLWEATGQPTHEHFLLSREGIAPAAAARRVGMLRRLSPRFLRWITLPAWAERRSPGTRTGSAPGAQADEKATFVLTFGLRHLLRLARRLGESGGDRSNWSEYESCTHYTSDSTQAKESFVASAVQATAATRVLDVGCNTGRYSRIAAASGAEVVAIDIDPVVVGRLWTRAAREDLKILPLIQNLAIPSPATGWRNQECPSFLERARGRFDLVLMLAVIHHLLVTDRIPIDEIVDIVSQITCRDVVVEFVSQDDPMFRQIARGREHLFAWWTADAFERAWLKRFTISAKRDVPGTTRVLYHLTKPS